MHLAAPSTSSMHPTASAATWKSLVTGSLEAPSRAIFRPQFAPRLQDRTANRIHRLKRRRHRSQNGTTRASFPSAGTISAGRLIQGFERFPVLTESSPGPHPPRASPPSLLLARTRASRADSPIDRSSAPPSPATETDAARVLRRSAPRRGRAPLRPPPEEV